MTPEPAAVSDGALRLVIEWVAQWDHDDDWEMFIEWRDDLARRITTYAAAQRQAVRQVRDPDPNCLRYSCRLHDAIANQDADTRTMASLRAQLAAAEGADSMERAAATAALKRAERAESQNVTLTATISELARERDASEAAREQVMKALSQIEYWARADVANSPVDVVHRIGKCAQAALSTRTPGAAAPNA